MWLSLSYGTQVKLPDHISNIICDCTAAISSFFFLCKALLQIWFSFVTPVHWRDTWDYKSVVKNHISWNLGIKKFDFLMKNFDSLHSHLNCGRWQSWVGARCVLISNESWFFRPLTYIVSALHITKPHSWKADLKICPLLNLYMIQRKVFQNHIRQKGPYSLFPFFLFSGNEVLTSIYSGFRFLKRILVLSGTKMFCLIFK